MPCHPVRRLAKALCAANLAPPLLRVITTTPQYGVPVDELLALAARGALRLNVYVATWDVVHSDHEAFWRAAETRVCAARRGGMRVRVLRGRTHWGVCLGLYALGLHRDDSLWRDEPPPADGDVEAGVERPAAEGAPDRPVEGGSSTRGPRAPHARL